jgi:hypothetical protein
VISGVYEKLVIRDDERLKQRSGNRVTIVVSVSHDPSETCIVDATSRVWVAQPEWLGRAATRCFIVRVQLKSQRSIFIKS